MFGEHLCTPKYSLQKYIRFFSIVSFSQVELSFVLYAPHTLELYIRMRRNKASKHLLQGIVGNLNKSR